MTGLRENFAKVTNSSPACSGYSSPALCLSVCVCVSLTDHAQECHSDVNIDLHWNVDSFSNGATSGTQSKQQVASTQALASTAPGTFL